MTFPLLFLIIVNQCIYCSLEREPKWEGGDQTISKNYLRLFPGGSDGKASVYNAGDLGSSPGLGRSPEEGNGNPLQHYCLENSMDREAW